MAKNSLEDLSIGELQKKKQGLKVIIGILTGVIIIYAVYMFYQMFSGTWDSSSPLIVFPMTLFIVILPVNKSMKSIDEELKKRQ